MAAKRSIIKELRQEIRDLQTLVRNQELSMKMRERHFLRIQESHEDEISWINTYTNVLANTLQHKFEKELAWQALSEDPESQIRHVRDVIKGLKKLCAKGLSNG